MPRWSRLIVSSVWIPSLATANLVSNGWTYRYQRTYHSMISALNLALVVLLKDFVTRHQQKSLNYLRMRGLLTSLHLSFFLVLDLQALLGVTKTSFFNGNAWKWETHGWVGDLDPVDPTQRYTGKLIAYFAPTQPSSGGSGDISFMPVSDQSISDPDGALTGKECGGIRSFYTCPDSTRWFFHAAGCLSPTEACCHSIKNDYENLLQGTLTVRPVIDG